LGDFRASWMSHPHLLTLLVARRVGQMVIAHFHSVTGQLQMLTNVAVVHHMVSGLTAIVWNLKITLFYIRMQNSSMVYKRKLLKTC
jgi:hypothetical protein